MSTLPKCCMSRTEQAASYEYHRRRYLPAQIDATERKLQALRNEARRYGLDDLAGPQA